MGYFLTEQPPTSLEEDAREYLARVFDLINAETGNNDQIDKYGIMPRKLSIGKLYYFTQAITSEPIIDAEGLYLYKSTGWVKMA